MKKLNRPLSQVERDLCMLVLSTPETHDDQGCPAHRLYKSIAEAHRKEPDSEVVKKMWNWTYDDGRSCPMAGIHYMVQQLMIENP